MNRVGELACLPAELRLKNLLLRLLDEAGVATSSPAGRHIALPLKRKELAKIIAVTPEHLSRLLRRLGVDGVLAIDGGTLMIKDAHRLKASVDVALTRLGTSRQYGRASPL